MAPAKKPNSNTTKKHSLELMLGATKCLTSERQKKLDLSENAFEAYGKKVVVADPEEAGYENVVRHVLQTSRGGGVDTSEAEICNGIYCFQSVTEEEVLANY